jgi:aryl-alcohol dehydrogenase-like predicted oxidoreductase
MSTDQNERPADLQKSIDETKVEYLRLGSSGLKLSLPILGAMSFGHKDWQPWVVDDYDEVEKLLLAAYKMGLTAWDTAK